MASFRFGGRKQENRFQISGRSQTPVGPMDGRTGGRLLLGVTISMKAKFALGLSSAVTDSAKVPSKRMNGDRANGERSDESNLHILNDQTHSLTECGVI